MKILFCGDVVGRSGREAVTKHVPKLRQEHGLDFVLVNCDNAAGGFGISRETCAELLKAGADALTGGDHVWDQKDAASLVETEKRLLRPHNYPPRTPGTGIGEFQTKSGKKIVVLHLLGQVFLKDYLDSPFDCADRALAPYRLGQNVDAIIVDMHAEATSEKMGMGLALDSKVSAVVGSHTHVPTNDCRILMGGTAYQTDAGMCGDYNSVIGFNPAAPMDMFRSKIRKQRMEPATGEGTLSAVLIETDDTTGFAKSITPIMRGGILGN